MLPRDLKKKKHFVRNKFSQRCSNIPRGNTLKFNIETLIPAKRV